MISTVSPLTADGKLVLAAMKVKSDAPVTDVRKSIHHIFIVDRSGSMYNDLPKVVDDLKAQARLLQKGDAVSFLWFSSRGQFGNPIKGYRVGDESSLVELDRLFDEQKRAMSMTCFSDALGEVKNILQDTSFLQMRNCLTFFSDGWANSPSVSAEQTAVRKIMQELNGKLDLVLTVSYGDYSDRQFLAEMAQLAGGENIASAYLTQFSSAMQKFIRRAEVTEPRIQVAIPNRSAKYIFSLANDPESGGITLYQADDNGDVYFSPSKNDKNLYLVLGSDDVEKQSGLEQLNLQESLRNKSADGLTESEQNLLEASYAASVVLSQNGQQDTAIEILGYLGDVALVEKLGGAYTPSEKANAEDFIRSAALNPANRWAKGKDFGCLPKPDAFCLLDLLELLNKDESVRFHPRHESFVYKKIGRGGKQREGYPEFKADKDVSGSFDNFVWNKEFLNLSVLTRITGTVSLPEVVVVDSEGKLDINGNTALKRPDSLAEIFPTFQWRNYTLVKDGFLNVQRLPITSSTATADKISEEELWVEHSADNGKTFGILALDAIPVINKVIAENPPSAQNLANLVLEDSFISGNLKVLKSLRDELDPDKEIVKKNEWTTEEQRFLYALGFRDDGSYSPPVDKDEATDEYEATSFGISIKGFSSFPKLDDLRSRLQDGKKLTSAMIPMKDQLLKFDEETKFANLKDKIVWVDEQMQALKTKQKNLRNEIQKPKFAMLLGHKWFTDVAKTEDEFTLPVALNNDENADAKIQIKKKIVKI